MGNIPTAPAAKCHEKQASLKTGHLTGYSGGAPRSLTSRAVGMPVTSDMMPNMRKVQATPTPSVRQPTETAPMSAPKLLLEPQDWKRVV